MALTRIKAGQISNIDYKQAVRVITVANVTLSGGAPSTVDGVNLVANDRVLVAGQGTASQNGLYYVATLGTGSNGTWTRTSDANEDGEIQAGMIVMVTEGTTYKDTQWKLTTNDPITIGVSNLVFEQNSAYAFGNIYANGTAVLSSAVGGTVTFTPGAGMVISANNTTKTITFAATGGGGGSGGNVTVSETPPGSPSVGDWWIDSNDATPYLYYAATNNGLASQWAETEALYSFSNGSSGGSGTPGGNTTEVQYNDGGSFAGSPNFNFDGSNVTIAGSITAGNILPQANVTYSLGSTSVRWKDLWIANSSIYMGDIIIGTVGSTLTINGANVITGNAGAPLSTSGNVVAGNVTTTGLITATANITGGNLLTGGLISATSSITSANGITATANVTGGNITTAGIMTSTGNAIHGNVLTAGVVSATANVTGGNLLTGGLISATSSITSANGITATANVTGGNITTAGLITATGNITGGNILTAGLISATGNVTGAYIFGNGSQLTGISTGSSSKISNGTSEANIGTSGGNANITIGGTSNVGVFATTGLFITGLTSVTSNVIAGNVTTAGLITATGNITGGNILTGGLISATSSITSANGITATANVTGGNITTAGLISATGNITGGNLSVSTGTITVGNILGSAANGIGNIGSSTNYFDTLFVTTASVLGNVNSGNLITAGLVSAGGKVNDSIGDLREIVQNANAAATYTLAATDNGKHINYTGASGNVAVPASIFASGDAVTIYNNQAANITIVQNTGVTLRLAGTGTTGNRTLAQYGLSTILCVAANTFVISGAGLT